VSGRRPSHRGQSTQLSVDSSGRGASSRRHVQGVSQASSHKGRASNSVGWAHRHVAAAWRSRMPSSLRRSTDDGAKRAPVACPREFRRTSIALPEFRRVAGRAGRDRGNREVDRTSV